MMIGIKWEGAKDDDKIVWDELTVAPHVGDMVTYVDDNFSNHTGIVKAVHWHTPMSNMSYFGNEEVSMAMLVLQRVEGRG